MATYAYRSISECQKIQSLWESGASVKEIAQDFDLSVSAIYTELKRGYSDTFSMLFGSEIDDWTESDLSAALKRLANGEPCNERSD